MATPQTRRDDTVDTLHGQQVADPYRWLEDPDSTETRAWVAEQNRHSREHLDALPCREWFRRTMTGVVGRPRAGTPDKVGDRYVVSRNDGSQQQDLWFVADTLEELRQGGRLLLDPNTFSEDGTSSLAGYNASKDGRWLAFLVSDGGSDWSSIRLLDLAGGHEVDDVVRKVKFSEATWLPDHSSYLYLHYPTEGSGVGTEAAALPGGQLRRHYVGEPQDNDELVLELPENPRLSISPTLSHDGRWLAVSLHEGTSEKNRLWVYPVQTADGATVIGEPLKVVDEAVAGFDPVRFDGDQVFLLDRPRGAAGPGGPARPHGVPRHRPRGPRRRRPRERRGPAGRARRRRRAARRAPGRRTAPADALRPGRLRRSAPSTCPAARWSR